MATPRPPPPPTNLSKRKSAAAPAHSSARNRRGARKAHKETLAIDPSAPKKLSESTSEGPPVKFKAVFERARREGYFLTMHCDVDQQNSTEHIRQCLEEIGVNRIDHGVNVLDTNALIDEVARRQLALTICPVSNAFVTNGSKAKEIKRMLELGIRATVHSATRLIFAATSRRISSAPRRKPSSGERTWCNFLATLSKAPGCRARSRSVTSPSLTPTRRARARAPGTGK